MAEENKKDNACCDEKCCSECCEEKKCCDEKCCESALEDLKKAYSEWQEKYNLPSFEEMNEDFGIERMSEVEVDLPMREIRRFVSDKVRNYERFIEAILNPSNANIFIFTIIKVLGKEDKEKLSEIYKKLVKREVDLIEMDVVYDEEKEVKFVKEFCSEWQEMKPIILEVLGKIKGDWDKEVEKGSKGY